MPQKPQAQTLGNDRWFSEDKFFHWSVSAVLIGASYHFLHCRIKQEKKASTIVSLSSTFSLGVMKEIYDKRVRKKYFSYKDLVYNILGIATGYFLFIY